MSRRSRFEPCFRDALHRVFVLLAFLGSGLLLACGTDDEEPAEVEAVEEPAEVEPAEVEPAEESADPEATVGHLRVRAVYAAGGPEATDARFVVETTAGERVEGPTRRDGFDLDAGRYRVTASVGEAEASAETEVRGDERTELEIVLDAGVLELAALAAEGGSPLGGARFRILSGQEDIRGERAAIAGPTSRSSFVLPAGSYMVRVEEDLASAEEEVEVRAGERTETAVVLGAGVLQAHAVEEDGSPVSDGVRWTILSAEEDLQGRRQTLAGPTSRNQYVLPAGEYLLQAQIDDRVAQERIEIEAGTRLELEVTVPSEGS